MKRLITLICVALSLLIAGSAAAAAASVDLAPSEEIYAVLSMEDGGVVVDEAPDARELSGVDSYELYYEDEPVLSVEQQGAAATGAAPAGAAARSYYSVNFTLEGTTDEVFLTGLHGDQVQTIQNHIIDYYLEGSDFEMSDLGFIDAEKLLPRDDGDDYLCWAASCSDMLTYTGWAAQAGFDGNEDDVFEAFINSYEDYGSNQSRGFAWFFNGAAVGGNNEYYGAVIEDYPNSGGYLNDYAFDSVSDECELVNVSGMNNAAQRLREGCAVGLGVYVYYSDDPEHPGGHAITMWGYVVDNSLEETDPARYKSIFVTDSDSNEITGDRRDSVNVMSMFNLSLDSEGGYYFWYDYGYSWASIFDYSYLLPCDENAPAETDPAATRNKQNTADLAIGTVYTSDTNNDRDQATLFESGTNVYCAFKVQHTGDINSPYKSYIYPCMTVTDSQGSVVYSNTNRIYSVTLNSNGFVVPPFLNIGALAEGDYTVTCSVNPDHAASGVLTEAYYTNNSRSVKLRVRDSYILGDFDGSGSIDIMDATKIQRKLADFDVMLDDRADARGDVNGGGLSILDVTQIQRHIADLDVEHPVGVKKLYR